MQQIAITDIGNQKNIIKRRVIEFFKLQKTTLKEQIERIFNVHSASVNACETNYDLDDMYNANFEIDGLGIVTFSVPFLILDKMFCKHLNVGDIKSKDTINENDITVSHINFFNKMIEKLMKQLFPKSNCSHLKFEKQANNKIQVSLQFDIEQSEKELTMSFNDSSLDFFSEDLEKAKPFNKEDVIRTLNMIPLDLNAILMKTELSINQVDELSVGDIIDLQKQEFIDVKVGNHTLFKGQLVTGDNAQLGVKYE